MNVRCISPIDGTVYAQREISTRSEAKIAIERAKLAQVSWVARPLSERISLVQSGRSSCWSSEPGGYIGTRSPNGPSSTLRR